MIEAVRSDKGQSRAKVICDECSRDDVVPCNHERGRGSTAPAVNEGQVLRKIEQRGWALVKGTLRCPACEARRKAAAPRPQPETIPDPAAMETAVSTAAEIQPPALRRPTPAQKRQIIGLLEDAYDDDAKRYRNPTDTDRTLAEVIGGGCLWGWVAEIREELFGPDTRNAEINAIRSEMKRIEGLIGNLTGETRKLDDAMAALKVRLDKVMA